MPAYRLVDLRSPQMALGAVTRGDSLQVSAIIDHQGESYKVVGLSPDEGHAFDFVAFLLPLQGLEGFAGPGLPPEVI